MRASNPKARRKKYSPVEWDASGESKRVTTRPSISLDSSFNKSRLILQQAWNRLPASLGLFGVSGFTEFEHLERFFEFYPGIEARQCAGDVIGIRLSLVIDPFGFYAQR